MEMTKNCKKIKNKKITRKYDFFGSQLLFNTKCLGLSWSRRNSVNLKIKFLQKGVGPGNVIVVAVVCVLYYKRVQKSRSLNEVTSDVETHEYISH